MKSFLGRVLAWALTGALGLGIVSPVRADEPRGGNAAVAVHPLLNQVRTAYKKLGGYEDHGELRVEYAWIPKGAMDNPRTVTAPCRLAFRRPDKFAMSFGGLRLLSNGRDLVTVIDSLKRYQVKPAPGTLGRDTFRGLPGELLTGDAGGIPVEIVLSLMLGDDSGMGWHAPLVEDADREIDGRPCKCLRFGGPDQPSPGVFVARIAPTHRLLIDAETKLIRAVEIEMPPPRRHFSVVPLAPTFGPPVAGDGVAVPAQPPVEAPPVVPQALVPVRWTWRAGTINAAPEPGTFDFEPPAAYTKVRTEDDFFAAPSSALPTGALPNGAPRADDRAVSIGPVPPGGLPLQGTWIAESWTNDGESSPKPVTLSLTLSFHGDRFSST